MAHHPTPAFAVACCPTSYRRPAGRYAEGIASSVTQTKTCFLCRYLSNEAVRREINDGLSVVEHWNGADDFVFFRLGASARRVDMIMSLPPLAAGQAFCTSIPPSLLLAAAIDPVVSWATHGSTRPECREDNSFHGGSDRCLDCTPGKTDG